ncbi:MAG: PIN domain-containing protein [Patescibacteria group bacterium]
MAKNRVFLDSSTLIAAILSQSGGSFYILNRFRNDFEFQINNYIFDELMAIADKKFSIDKDFKNKLFLLIGMVPIKILNDSSKSKTDIAAKFINKNDAPILASALIHSNYLLTLDNDFLKESAIEFAQKKNLIILKPKDFIEKFRNKI